MINLTFLILFGVLGLVMIYVSKPFRRTS